MKDEFTHKISLFKRYRETFGEEEMRKRLGLKDWEYEYIRKRLITEGFVQEGT